MTREEAIDYNKNLRMYMKLSDKNQPCKFLEENYIALDMAIKALEQEPCEDAISREEAIDACNQSVNILEATDRIKDLPPVTPQEPFMNKPCVAHQVCHEDKVKILDKIRAEIELEKLGYPPSAGYYKAIVKVLQIIDKYKGNKAESEDKEIHSVIDGDFFKGI